MAEAANVRLGAGTPPTPPSGEGALYFDQSDGQLYVIDANGNTVGPITAGGGGGPPSGPAGGDLTGSYPSPTVAALQGTPVSTLPPGSGQVLAYNGVQWAPAAVGSGVTASNVIWVQGASQGGDDSTGVRGNSSKPFNTLSGALAVAQDGDVILLGAGAFSGPSAVGPVSSDIYNINSTLKNIAIVGQGQKDTIIVSGAPAKPVFSIEYGVPVANTVIWEKFVLARCTVVGNGFSEVFKASGPGTGFFSTPNAINYTGLCLFDVDVTQQTVYPPFTPPAGYNNFVISGCEYVRMERVRTLYPQANILLVCTNIARGIFSECTFSGIYDSIDFSILSAPDVSCPGSRYERCSTEQAAISGQTRSTWVDCRINGLMIDYSPLAVAGTPVQGPQIVVRGGSIVTLVLGNHGIPDDATASMTFEFSEVALGNVTASVAGSSPVNRRTVTLKGCSISGSTTAGKATDIVAKTSRFALPAATGFSTPSDGTILPPMFDLPAVATTPFPGVSVLPFGFNLPVAAYQVLLESTNIADGFLSVASKSPTGVTAQASVGGFGNVAGVIYIVS